jgi:hypothetical protein
VRKLRVINPDTGKAIAAFEALDLANRLALVGDSVARESKLPTNAIRPGERAILFIEFGVNIGSVPKRFQHEITYAATGDNQIVALQSPVVAVNSIEMGSPCFDQKLQRRGTFERKMRIYLRSRNK